MFFYCFKNYNVSVVNHVSVLILQFIHLYSMNNIIYECCVLCTSVYIVIYLMSNKNRIRIMYVDNGVFAIFLRQKFIKHANHQAAIPCRVRSRRTCLNSSICNRHTRNGVQLRNSTDIGGLLSGNITCLDEWVAILCRFSKRFSVTKK